MIPPTEADIRNWTRRFMIAELCEGLAWSAMLILAVSTKGVGIEVFQFATMLIIVSVSTILASTDGGRTWTTIKLTGGFRQIAFSSDLAG